MKTFSRILSPLALLLTLTATSPALAGPPTVTMPGYTGLNPIMHLQPGALGIFPQHMQDQWTEWRREAAAFAESVAKDKGLAKKVGKPMDRAGVVCLMWIDLANRIIIWNKAIQARYEAVGERAPEWVAQGKNKAVKRRDENCKDDSGDGGSTMNLGRQYMEVLWAAQGDAEALKNETTKELGAFARFVAGVKDLAAIGLSGELIPAGLSLPVINPELFMPKQKDWNDYQL